MYIVNLICQSLNLSCNKAVQIADCIFTYFCAGHIQKKISYNYVTLLILIWLITWIPISAYNKESLYYTANINFQSKIGTFIQ